MIKINVICDKSRIKLKVIFFYKWWGTKEIILRLNVACA